MRRSNELLPKDLKDICNPNLFKFETTKELVDTNDLIYGQERGIRALDFGVGIDVKGYNLYLEGPSGVGKTMYTKRYLTAKASKKKFQTIGAISIILTIQMHQLQSHFQQDKVKYLKKQWKVL